LEFDLCRAFEGWDGEDSIPLLTASLIMKEMKLSAEANGDEAVVG
jgi:hypothetical protein